ncbi:anti-sigma factor RsbA family regulatory protein [Streptacidiphilus sp. N1-3]|uniref:Anti-sigma factor RsbA family regulatory protein n=1 Tax=Streptacidiphilus alkalitolerans TaxID=3342712 RepID=A0ABV6X1I9_9ACTN
MTQPPGSPPTAAATAPEPGFRHELYAYEGEDQFLQGVLSFIDDARAGREVVLVAVTSAKERLLRDRLEAGGAAGGVSFLDVTALGRNPGRLIPAWQEWITKRAADGHAVRGISESSWDGRTASEAEELRYHEWLLNLAFARSPAWWLLCPYDSTLLDSAVLEAAGRCHPQALSAGVHGPNPGFVEEPYAFAELGAPCDPAQELAFRTGELAAVRAKVTACATEHGMDPTRLQELLIAATEVASNSTKYGGGRGTLRSWVEDGTLVCEFHDSGHIQDPLIGRVRPTIDQNGGRGMWLVHQLCDLVQIRSTAQGGTTVRLHTALD